MSATRDGREIVLPFQPDFRDALRSGRKTCTARMKRMGRPGNTFTAFGVRFRLVRITRVTLGAIAHLHYEAEGLDSPLAFRRIWERLHHHRFDLEQMVWLHAFERIVDAAAS